MLPLPQIEHNPEQLDQVEARLWVDPSLPFFAGHFPGHPLVPGAVQVHWMLQLAGAYGEGWHLPLVNLAKFLKPLRPGCEVTLVLRRTAAGTCMGEIRSLDGVHSKFVLESPRNEDPGHHSQL